MIVSVHFAKTAGTSFAGTLEQHFGARLLRDYLDFPMNASKQSRNNAAILACPNLSNRSFEGIECVHGHFLAVKYLLLPSQSTKFITWMRHPVDRVLSNYYFWRKSYNPAADHALHRRVIEEDWSLERFCLGDEFKDYYSQMLFAFPIDNFDFIGITEFYEEDLHYFSKQFLQTTSTPLRVNVGDREGGTYQVEPGLKKKIENFHAKDMVLYRWALEQRQSRYL
jgi:hypothetical protein